jgi:AraC-like DNA-binding protein
MNVSRILGRSDPMPFVPPRVKGTVCSAGMHQLVAAWRPLKLDASSALLANVVEGVTDWDIPNSEAAADLTIRALPHTATYLVFQYRTPIRSYRRFGEADHHHAPYRHVATRAQKGIAVLRPMGPVGVIAVQLRAEASVRILGERLRDFVDVKINLEDVFRACDVSLLAEMLAEAPNSRERLACVQRFLLANLREREADQVACRAAAFLRRNPFLRMRRLATDLGVSERHLSRRFQTVFGVGLKCFARAARLENIVIARRRGLSWSDVASTCGFSDQSHMIDDVNAIIGVAPGRALGQDGVLAW